MSMSDQIPSGIHSPKSDTPGVESVLPPFLILGSLPAPFSSPLQPSGATHPSGLPDPDIQVVTGEAGSSSNVCGLEGHICVI